MNDFFMTANYKNAAMASLLCALVWLSYAVLREFLVIISWALIVAYVMWPLYLKLCALLQFRSTLSAAVMTGLLSLIITLALYWLVRLMQTELRSLYQSLLSQYNHPPAHLPENISRLPWLGNYLQQYLDKLNADEAGVRAQLLNWSKQWLGQLGRFLGGVGHNLMSLGLVLMTLFFCFRDGEAGIKQLRLVLNSFLGENLSIYFKAAGDTAHAVVYGLVLAAMSQGLIAGIGYSVAGIDAPVLLAVLTAMLAMVPLGATLIWLPVSFGLIVADDSWRGFGLLLWGIFAISTVDNVIRPLVISGAGHIPFLIVVFGVFGGLSAFGAVGLFIGPIILSVLFAVWRVWLEQLNAPTTQ